MGKQDRLSFLSLLRQLIEEKEDNEFNSNYIKVSGRALLLSLDFSTLPLIHTL